MKIPIHAPMRRPGELGLSSGSPSQKWRHPGVRVRRSLRAVRAPQSLVASALIALCLAAGVARAAEPKERSITNASYDVTREFYDEFNKLFVAHWQKQSGETVTVHQSHGGSSKQARAVIDGLEADVVTMNQGLDIDAIAASGRLARDWAQRLPNDSVPFTTTIVFVVRKGNPKNIRDWSDLVKSGTAVIVPNPKTSGNGRYSYLAAWSYASKRDGGGDAAALAFEKALFANVPVLDTGGRAATTTFAQRDLGDVLLTFENEVALIQAEFGKDKFEAVYPSTSIEAELPVAWVDAVVRQRNSADLAKAYLTYLYSPEAQEIGARRGFRPTAPAVLEAHQASFPALKLVTIEEISGSWDAALKSHFAEGASFDQIYGGK